MLSKSARFNCGFRKIVDALPFGLYGEITGSGRYVIAEKVFLTHIKNIQTNWFLAIALVAVFAFELSKSIAHTHSPEHTVRQFLA